MVTGEGDPNRNVKIKCCGDFVLSVLFIFLISEKISQDTLREHMDIWSCQFGYLSSVILDTCQIFSMLYKFYNNVTGINLNTNNLCVISRVYRLLHHIVRLSMDSKREKPYRINGRLSMAIKSLCLYLYC